MNTIYLKTPKAEREGAKLADELKRVLSLLDGQSGSDDLAKRAAPSLRKSWSEIINILEKQGYIVSNPGVNIEPKHRSVHKLGAAASANDLAHKKMLAAKRVIAVLEAAAAAGKAKSDIETEQLIAALEAAAAADKARSDHEAKSKADTQQKAERDARTAELKTFFATAKEKAAAEIKQSEQKADQIKQSEQKAASTRAEIQPVAAREELAAEAMANSAAKRKVKQEKAHTIAELEAAIRAAKTKSDIVEKSKSELKSKSLMLVSDTLRLRELEIENEALKKLLVESYIEIAALKAALGIKA